MPLYNPSASSGGSQPSGKYVYIVNTTWGVPYDISGDTVIEYLTADTNIFTSADLSGCTALKYAKMTNTGGVTGTASFSGDSALTFIDFSSGDWSGVDFTGCSALVSVTFDLANNGLGAVDLSDSPLIEVATFTGAVVTSIDLTGLTVLAELDLTTNSMTTIDIGDCVSLLDYVGLAGNALDQAAVDGVLADLDSFGLSGGEVDLSGGTNSAPSAAGIISAASLTGKGWTVTTN